MLENTIIIGAGLAGLSAGYHIRSKKCEIFEKNNFVRGHIFSKNSVAVISGKGPYTGEGLKLIHE